MSIRKIPILFLSFMFCISSLQAIPAQILIIRNAEDAPKEKGLSTKGKIRAAAYVGYFLNTKDFIAHGTPAAIYSMKPGKNEPSEKPRETVKPLAEKLGLTLKETYERDDYKQMVEEIKKDASLNGKTVLICWDSHAIPELTRAFGALQAPARWIDNVYDRVWEVNLEASGRTTFHNIPQKLLFGDTAY